MAFIRLLIKVTPSDINILLLLKKYLDIAVLLLPKVIHAIAHFAYFEKALDKNKVSSLGWGLLVFRSFATFDRYDFARPISHPCPS